MEREPSMPILDKYINGPKHLTLHKVERTVCFTDRLSWIYETALFVCKNVSYICSFIGFSLSKCPTDLAQCDLF